jgi:hypothetical protein
VGFSYSFISFILGSVLFLYESLVGYYIYIFVWLSRKHFFCCHVHWMGISSSIFHLPSSIFPFLFLFSGFSESRPAYSLILLV